MKRIGYVSSHAEDRDRGRREGGGEMDDGRSGGNKEGQRRATEALERKSPRELIRRSEDRRCACGTPGCGVSFVSDESVWTCG